LAFEHRCSYLGNDAIEIVHDLIVGESDHPVAKVLEVFCPHVVLLLSSFVNWPVDLNDQAEVWAAEVQDECAQRVLTSEPCALDPTSSDRLP